MKISLCFLLLSLFVMACSSSPNLYYIGGGTQCPDDGSIPDPIPTDVTALAGHHAMTWDAIANQIKGGATLTYINSTLYFLDGKSTVTALVSDSVDPSTKQGSTGVSCMRNYNNISQIRGDIPVEGHVLTALSYTNGAWTLKSKTVGFKMDEKNPLQVDAFTADDKNPDSSDSAANSPDWRFRMRAGPAKAKSVIFKEPTTVTFWCVGKCDGTDKTTQYEVRASRVSSDRPVDKLEMIVVYYVTAPKTN